MDTRRFVIGTLVGGVTVCATGTLIFAMAPFRDFLAYAMNAGAAMDVAREPQLIWAVALGALSYSALVTLAIGSRARARSLTIGSGIKIGAVVGFLLWFTADFMLYGVSNVLNFTSTVVAPLVELVPGAIAGGVIAAVLGKISSTRWHGIAIAIALLPSSGRAQTVAQSFDELLGVLKSGQMVVVTDDRGRNTTGRISDLSATSLSLMVPGARTSGGEVTMERREFPADAVNVIRSTDPLWNGTLIGLGIGAAATIGQRQACGDTSQANPSDVDGIRLCKGLATGFGLLLVVPLGTIMGAVIDWNTGHERLYLKDPQQRVVVSPLVSKTGFGIWTSVSF